MAIKKQPNPIKIKTVKGSKTDEKAKGVRTLKKDTKLNSRATKQPKTWRELVAVTLKNGGTMQQASKLWKSGKVK